jgi:hypothetical protein
MNAMAVALAGGVLIGLSAVLLMLAPGASSVSPGSSAVCLAAVPARPTGACF